jgi:Spy/CpxP family protein refolding chaperone
MAATYFALGVVATLVAVTAALAALYFYLKSTRTKPVIRGYLDLIPDLTAEQKASVRKIRETFLPTVHQIREKLRSERGELARLLFADPPDRERIYVVARQIMGHQSELEKEVIEHILEERELLTPSQQRKFYEIIVDQFSTGGLGVHDVRGRH